MVTRSEVSVVDTGVPGAKGDSWHTGVGTDDCVVSEFNGETLVFPATPRGTIELHRDIVVIDACDYKRRFPFWSIV
uniref:hypothetical protein n=1 Tax=Amycolatopsis sp. CA-096443 TaxID=3239919 RepID=UPI003F49198E